MQAGKLYSTLVGIRLRIESDRLHGFVCGLYQPGSGIISVDVVAESGKISVSRIESNPHHVRHAPVVADRRTLIIKRNRNPGGSVPDMDGRSSRHAHPLPKL